MNDIENRVAGHYGGPDLLSVILAVAGAEDGSLNPDVLEQIDEFHVGGPAATERLLDGMNLAPGARLLDIGSGVGGPARRAVRRGAVVTGVDLTERFVATATELSRRVGTEGQPRFLRGSGLALPFEDASFDAAMMLHVGMNIADKGRLMTEVARVLRPGGVFAVYDLLRLDDSTAAYPLPWAAESGTSFLDTADAYRRTAEAAGLHLTAEVPRADEAKAFFAAMRTRADERKAASLPPAPGVGTVMGDDAPLKLANLAAAVMQGHVAPSELHFRKAG